MHIRFQFYQWGFISILIGAFLLFPLTTAQQQAPPLHFGNTLTHYMGSQNVVLPPLRTDNPQERTLRETIFFGNTVYDVLSWKDANDLNSRVDATFVFLDDVYLGGG